MGTVEQTMSEAVETPRRRTLYDLAGHLRDLYEHVSTLALEGEGEVPEELFEALDEAEGELEEKMEGYGRLMKQWEADAEIMDATAKTYQDEADKYKARAKTLRNQVDRLKRRAQDGLEVADADKVETEHFKFWLQNSTPSVVLVNVESPDDLPEQFRRVSVSEDRKALADALKGPEDSEDYRLAAQCARLEQGRHLRWR